MSAEAKLKHLQFVQDYSKAANGAVTFAESLYSRAKSFTPSFAAPYITTLEDTVVARAAPALATAADTAEKLLRTADEQVGDGRCARVWCAAQGFRPFPHLTSCAQVRERAPLSLALLNTCQSP